MTPPVQRLAPGVLLLTGGAVDALLYAVQVAQRARQRNNLPPSHALAELASAAGQTDARRVEPLEDEMEMIATEEAARMLECSSRQARRLAPRLGGRRVGGRWLLDRRAVVEHIEGRTP